MDQAQRQQSARHLPFRVTVKRLIESRYPSNRRPTSWDRRVGGTDTIETSDGDLLVLESSGQQSPPGAGWIILITEGDARRGYRWTLYGFAPGADVSGLPV